MCPLWYGMHLWQSVYMLKHTRSCYDWNYWPQIFITWFVAQSVFKCNIYQNLKYQTQSSSQLRWSFVLFLVNLLSSLILVSNFMLPVMLIHCDFLIVTLWTFDVILNDDDDDDDDDGRFFACEDQWGDIEYSCTKSNIPRHFVSIQKITISHRIGFILKICYLLKIFCLWNRRFLFTSVSKCMKENCYKCTGCGGSMVKQAGLLTSVSKCMKENCYKCTGCGWSIHQYKQYLHL